MIKLPLTEKEENVLAYIFGYITDNDYAPTFQEIADHFGIVKSHASYFIYQLKKKGKIKIKFNKNRGISIK